MATCVPEDLSAYYLTEYLPNCPYHYHNPFASQKFLKFSSLIIFLITTPINLFGIYCIAAKSPVEMLTIKWCMLYLHSIATFTSAWMTIGFVPFAFFPACAGFTLGILSAINIPIQIQGYVAFGGLGMLALSLPILFENRHRYLVDHYKITRPASRIMFYTFNVLFVPCSLLGPFSIIPDQKSARQLILRQLACPAKNFFFNEVFVLSLDHVPITSYLTALTTVTVIQILYFGGHSLVYLAYGTTKTTSRSTRKLQRRFFLIISTQLTLPCVILLVPVLYFLFSMLSGYYSQALNNLSVLTMSLYGAIATLTMIILHRPYQKFVRQLFHCPISKFSKPRPIEVKPRKWVRRNAISLTTPVSF